MKKKAIAVAVALASFTTVINAAPKDNIWYVGGKLDLSQFHDANWYKDSLKNDGPTHEDQLTVGAFGGYQINPTVGLETSYDWLGRVPYKGTARNGAFKAHGVQLTVKLNYPINNNLDLYTRLGGMVWRADSKNSVSSRRHDTGVSSVLSSGIEWEIARDLATRLEYQWVNNIGSGNTVGVRPDNSMLSLGVSYRFGPKEETSIARIASETQDQNITLNSDILFNFNKSTLTTEGKKELDRLYDQINKIDFKNNSIIVLGFADRIGSDSYNQDLSQKRAHSVVRYLISKGIPEDKILEQGMGRSNSIMGNACDGITSNSELVKCFSPDRRVEIKIKEIKDITNKLIE